MCWIEHRFKNNSFKWNEKVTVHVQRIYSLVITYNMSEIIIVFIVTKSLLVQQTFRTIFKKLKNIIIKYFSQYSHGYLFLYCGLRLFQSSGCRVVPSKDEGFVQPACCLDSGYSLDHCFASPEPYNSCCSHIG